MGKKFDVIVVGELNVDLILNQLSSLPQVDKEVLAENMLLTMGSSSAIFASNLSSLGAKVAFIGKIGKDSFGNLVLSSLQNKKVDTTMILQSESLSTGATVILNYKENNAMITYPGAMQDLSIDDIQGDQLSQAGHLHFSSYFIQPGIKKNIAQLFRSAKELGMTTSFDTQWDPMETWELNLEEVLPYVDVFLPNQKEFLNLTGQATLDAAFDHVKKFAKTVVVKMGSKGSVSLHNGQTIHKPAYLNGQVIDAVGAGDSFNAGFIYKFIQKESIEYCQDFGNLTGAVSTTAAGGTTAFIDINNTMNDARIKFGYKEAM